MFEVFLNYLLKNASQSFYWTDTEGRILLCNEQQAKFFSFDNPSDLEGKNIFDIAKLLGWDMSIAEHVRQNDLHVMKTKKPQLVEEHAQLHGEKRYYLSSKSPLFNDEGEVIGIFGVSTDITDRKNMEEDLRLAKEKAEAANKIKIDFIQNMQHDIRTPFSGIYGMAKILQEQEDDSRKKEWLGDIANSAKELLDYCNQILDFSRIEKNESLPLLARKFNLRELMDSVIAAEKPSAVSRKLQLSVVYDNNLPLILVGDDYRLQRVLLNLTGNAIKFTHEGSVQLQVVLAAKEGKEAVIKIIIEDTGIGIPSDKVLYIYEKFTRATPANQGSYKGLGLGLTVVKQFIEDMGGEIDVISTPGNGTKFTCAFPFKIPLLSEVKENLV